MVMLIWGRIKKNKQPSKKGRMQQETGAPDRRLALVKAPLSDLRRHSAGAVVTI